MHLLEVAGSVAAAICGLKGAEYYRVHRLKHGNSSSERRFSGSHSIGFSGGDKELLKSLFKDLEIGRLKTEKAITDVVREEGSKTRTAVYESNR